MRRLILIKHARPEVVAGTPAHDWRLSDEGRAAAAAMVEALRLHKPAIIVSSDEPKARETAEILAEALKIPLEVGSGLYEHDRSNVPMMPSREFLSTLALFFKRPDRLILGRETAEEARRRFQQAIDGIVAAHPEGNIAVVTHGTVLALFAADHGAGDAFSLYRRLELPSMVVFTLPDFQYLDVPTQLPVVV